MHLLATGQPVTLTQVSEVTVALGIDSQAAAELLDAWTERNEHGDVVGLGLTLNRTSHQMTIGDTRVYAWCAMDTLIFPMVLDRPIIVASTAPDSGDIVRLRALPGAVADIHPSDAVVTWPVRTAQQVDLGSTGGIWASFCHHSFFFPYRAQAEQWAADRDNIEVLSLPDGLTVAQQLAAAWLRYGQ